MQSAEKGLFKLDDTLVSLANDYLRAISNGTSDLIQLFGPEVKAVTVRQLLQMTAGLTEYDTANTRAYQNSHRQDDLTPMWVLNVANHTFRCNPGTCGLYSSTNDVLLGLVAARFQHASSWDTLDQRAWTQRIPTDLPEVQPGGSLKALYYGMHGPYSAFTTAVAADGTHATVHGYQLPLDGTNCTTFLGCPALDVYTMSASGGWTCGNLVSTSTSVADFYWALLGPERKKYALLNDKSYGELLDFKKSAYFVTIRCHADHVGPGCQAGQLGGRDQKLGAVACARRGPAR